MAVANKVLKKDKPKKKTGRPAGVKNPVLSTMKKRRYFAGETLKLEWTESEVIEFIAVFFELIAEGVAPDHRILYLAGKFKRRNSEIAVLIIDLGERGFISEKGRGRSKRKFNIDEL